jgi:hypothetical protein
MKTVAISLAFGDIYKEAGIGPLKQPLDAAVARFKAVTAGITCDDYSLVVCTAGYSKKHPTVPQSERQASLAEQLGRYVGEYEARWASRLVAKPLCWSTRNEVRVGIKYAQRIAFVSKNEEAVVVIASNFTHLVRIWLYAILYTPRNWKIKMIWARHCFSLRAHLLEPPKIARDVIYILRVLWRLRRSKK